MAAAAFIYLKIRKTFWISFSILQSSQKKYESGRYFNNFYNFVRDQKNKVGTYKKVLFSLTFVEKINKYST